MPDNTQSYDNTEPRPIKRGGIEIAESYAAILADYAAKENNIQRESGDNRSIFQRDRDRIIHSQAFRRLMYKTQVFVNHESDHFRTRLTHTLEVSQLARGICKSLALNEDLAEAVALGHDLGHTPFGHAVEKTFDEILEARAMGRFNHNEQSVRLVEILERRDSAKIGLGLSQDVLEGILKHTKDTSGLFPALAPREVCSHLEGQIVRAVDTIAYLCHDFEDAVKAGIVYKSKKKNPDFERELNNALEIIKDITRGKAEVIIEPHSDIFFTRELIHQLVMDLTDNTYANIETNGIKTREDIKNHPQLAVLSDPIEKKFKKLRGFLYDYIYKSQTITMMDDKAADVVKYMFEKFTGNPYLLPPKWLYRYNHVHEADVYSNDKSGAINSEIRVVCDYISSMTDRFALEEHERLSNPRIRL